MALDHAGSGQMGRKWVQIRVSSDNTARRFESSTLDRDRTDDLRLAKPRHRRRRSRRNSVDRAQPRGFQGLRLSSTGMVSPRLSGCLGV